MECDHSTVSCHTDSIKENYFWFTAVAGPCDCLHILKCFCQTGLNCRWHTRHIYKLLAKRTYLSFDVQRDSQLKTTNKYLHGWKLFLDCQHLKALSRWIAVWIKLELVQNKVVDNILKLSCTFIYVFHFMTSITWESFGSSVFCTLPTLIFYCRPLELTLVMNRFSYTWSFHWFRQFCTHQKIAAAAKFEGTAPVTNAWFRHNGYYRLGLKYACIKILLL